MGLIQDSLRIFNSKYCKYCLRISSIVLAILCFYTLHEIDWDNDPYFHRKDYARVAIAIFANLGLWIITTGWAKRNRIKSIITLLPTVIITTFVILMHSFWLPILFCLLICCLAFLVYRRGNERSI